MEIKILSVICSVIGLILIFIAVRNIQVFYIPIYEIGPEGIGIMVKTSGFVSHLTRHPNGHVFVTLEDGDSKIEVPLFSSFVKAFNQYNGQKASIDEISLGSLIEVEGTVGEYQGKLQIIPREPNDLKILYD